MKILIDNGHGINTPGKGSPYALNSVKPSLYIREWEYCRDIAKEIVKELKLKGYDAVLLVPEPVDVPLRERCRRANMYYQFDKDVFVVSIHLNASGTGVKWMDANGWSVYTSKGITKSDVLAEKLIDAAVKTFKGKKIRIYQNAHLSKDFEENFTILTGTSCPAVLTENFFQDNIEDVKYLLSEEGKKEVVRCHVDGIINYIKDTIK